MGMFGAIWAAIAGGAIAKDKIKENHKNKMAKINAEIDYRYGLKTNRHYMDSKGALRDLDTDDYVSYHRDRNGDFYYDYLPKGKLNPRPERHVNVSEQLRNKEDQEILEKRDPLHTVRRLQNGNYYDPLTKKTYRTSFYMNGPSNMVDKNGYYNSAYSKSYALDVSNYNIEELKTERFKDFDGEFYVDIETEELVRVSDGWKKICNGIRKEFKNVKMSEKEEDELFAEFVRLINKYRKERRM